MFQSDTNYSVQQITICGEVSLMKSYTNYIISFSKNIVTLNHNTNTRVNGMVFHNNNIMKSQMFSTIQATITLKILKI